MAIHMAFRARNCPESIRQRILAEANTDQALLELSVCAILHDRGDWLTAVMEADVFSGVTWRIQRSRRIKAFDPRMPDKVPEWPVGESQSMRMSRERSTDTWIRRGVFARKWWNAYWTAPDAAAAYAAWVLLLKCVDRRSYCWMVVPVGAEGSSSNVSLTLRPIA
jgi:hypothetical protein